MTANEQYLLELLLTREEFQSYESLANDLNVSVRSIRNLLQKLMPYLEKNHFWLEKKYGVGIRVISKVAHPAKFISEIDTSVVYRREVIKLVLLFQFRKKTSINRLSEMLFITKNSVIRDLRKIEKELAPYQLTLKKTYLGTEIMGQRKNIKNAIIDAVHRYGTSIIFDNRTLLSDNEKMASLILVESFEKLVYRLIKKTENVFSYTFNQDFFKSLVIHLLVDILLFGEMSRAVKQYDLQHIGCYFQKDLEDSLGFHFTDAYNKARLSEYFQAFEEVPPKNRSSNSAIFLLNSYENICRATVKNRETLLNELSAYLDQLALRAAYRIGVFHPYLSYLANEHDADFFALKLTIRAWENTLSKITDDELGFMLVIFLNHPSEPKRILSITLDAQCSRNSLILSQQLLEKRLPSCKMIDSTKEKSSDKRITFLQGRPINFENGEIMALDIFNEHHLRLLKQEMTAIEKAKQHAEMGAYFYCESIQVSHKAKNEVLTFISEFLLQQKLTDQAQLARIIEEDRRNPLCWRHKQTALLVIPKIHTTLSARFKFQLEKPIKWRENNDLVRVKEVYVFTCAKVNVHLMALLYQDIRM